MHITNPSVAPAVMCVCVRVCLRVRDRVSHRFRIEQEAAAPPRATQYAGFFVNGGIMGEEGDTRFEHD